MLRIHDRDRGASIVEYAAVLVLVAALIAVVGTSGIADRVREGITDEASEVLGASSSEPVEDVPDGHGGGGHTQEPEVNAPENSGGGASSGSVETVSNGDADSGDDDGGEGGGCG